MRLDLDAIRARDATDANITSREAIDAWFVQLRIDVRTLLAEVDRLRSSPTTVLQFGPDHPFSEVQHTQEWFDQFTEAIRQDERARALPVIEAARVLVQHGDCRADDDIPALRAALVRYEEVSRP